VPFPCPGCDAAIDRSPEAWALRCPACRSVIRARAIDAVSGDVRAYEVEITGRPETRRRIEVPQREEFYFPVRGPRIFLTPPKSLEPVEPQPSAQS